MTDPTPALRITAKRPGFRRAGIAHPAEPVVHLPGQFTPAQVEALMADPGLVVERWGDSPAPSVPLSPPLVDKRPRDALQVLTNIAETFGRLQQRDKGADGTPLVKVVEQLLG